MQYQTRREAKAAGAKTYYTGVPCNKGHDAIRYVNGGGCKTCLAERAKSMRDSDEREATLGRWNGSTRGHEAKMRWKDKDPKNAWACSAVGGAKARAAKRGLAFDLDKEYVRSLVPDACPVFGTPFVFFGRGIGPYSPSLDRKDPTRGYIKGNVAVISLKANAIKSDATISDIQAVLDWMRANS
jgi:hypothetical protein